MDHKLVHIDRSQKTAQSISEEFLPLLQNGLLLTLQEQGRLDEMQVRIAMEQLRAHHHDRAFRFAKEGVP